MELSERTKKILAILLFVASVFGIGAALYFMFFAPAATPPVETPVVTPPLSSGAPSLPSGAPATGQPTTPSGTGGALGGASAVAKGGLTQTTELTTAPVSVTTLAANGSSINYYDNADGRFYTIDANGNVQSLSDKTFPQVSEVAWNNNGDKAVLTFPDESKIVYDFKNETQVTLPSHWNEVQFSPVKDQIIAKSDALDPNNRWLVTSNADGSNVKAIQALGENGDKVQIAWSPNDQIVGFADTADAQGAVDRKLIIPIGKNQENYRGLTVEGLGFTPNWAPDGSRLLYSAAGNFSDSKPLLWITDATPGSLDQNRRSLGLNTWADKCTFSDANTLYCAVPTSLPENAGLMRVLYRGTPDQLYKVDLVSGRSSLVAIPAQDTPMERLKVSADGTSLFYTDASTGKLNRLRLK